MSYFAGIIHTSPFSGSMEKDENCLREISLQFRKNSIFPDSRIVSDGERGTAFLLPPGKKSFLMEELPYTVLLDGYILNKKELSELLRAKGILSISESTEELLAWLFHAYGTQTWEKLDGSFAIALFDREKKKLYLVRDRLGSKSLYYFCTSGITMFAGCIGALKKHESFPGNIEEQSLWDFLSLQYVPEGTIYRNVRKLSPGSFAEISFADRCFSVTKKYWKADFSVKENFSYSEACHRLRELLFKSVEKHLSCVPKEAEKGIFLSGGVDSCITGGICAKLCKGNLKAFSMGFDEAIYDEREQAAINFDHIKNLASGKMEHFISPVGADTLPLLLQLAEDHGSPYADASLLPTSLLCSFAKEKNISIAFCGDGADELFGGYERYLAMTMAGKLDRIPLPIRSLLLRCTNIVKDGGERSFTGRLRRFLRISCAAGSHRYFDLLDRCPEQMRQALFTPEFRSCLSYSGAEYFSSSAGVLSAVHEIEKLSETDILTYLPGDILPKVDISSMAFSLEVRAPFLDREVVEFAAMIPWEMKLHGRERKSILKYAFRDLLAPEISHAPKKGFGVPVAALLRSKWRTPAEELIFESTIGHSEFLNRETVHKLWQDHQNRKADNSYILWSIIGFALFLGEKKCCL